MRFPLWILFVAASFSGAGPAHGFFIDGFDAAQGPVTGAGNSSYVSDSSILGTERDVYLSSFPTTSSFSISNGVLNLSQTSGYTDVYVTYDGADANPANNLNLNGVNLLAGGGNAFEIKLLPTKGIDPHAHIWVRVYTNSSNYSEAHLVLDAADFPSILNIPFSSMSPFGVGADFSNVKAIQLELAIGSSINMDLNLDYFAVVPPPGPIETIDFQSLTHTDSGTTYLYYTYREKGFVFSDSRGVNGLGSFHTANPNYAGSTMLFNDTESDTSLSREDGGDFDFVGIDLAALQSHYPESGPVTFSGYYGTKLVVRETFNFDSNKGVQHFSPQMPFVKLTELRWPQIPPTHQFDNVQVRKNGGAGPGAQPEIVRDEAGLRVALTHLNLESRYTLRTSMDLVSWADVYTFTAYSPAMDAGQTPPSSQHLFYRLQLNPYPNE